MFQGGGGVWGHIFKSPYLAQCIIISNLIGTRFVNAMYSFKGRKHSPLTSLEMISVSYAAVGGRGEAVLKELI